jgi:PKD repeat protein
MLRKAILPLIFLMALVSVIALSRCGALLDLDLTATPTSGKAPLTVVFNADTSGYVGIIDFYWDFNDGEISCQHNPTHTFAEAGVYSVTCEATTDEGHSKRSSIEVTVTEP